jgi:hypothetical protein
MRREGNITGTILNRIYHLQTPRIHVTQSLPLSLLLSSRTVANATFQNLLINNVVPRLTVLLFLAVFSTHLPSLVLCRSHLFPILLPALEKFFHIVLPLHDDILACDSDSSVLFMHRRRVEIVDQLRRWMRLPLRLLGQVLVGFEELLGRVLSGSISTIPWALLVAVSGHVKDICSRHSGDFARSLRSRRAKMPVSVSADRYEVNEGQLFGVPTSSYSCEQSLAVVAVVIALFCVKEKIGRSVSWH